jgi:Fe2+ or Zn2+ uptake regulation protein
MASPSARAEVDVEVAAAVQARLDAVEQRFTTRRRALVAILARSGGPLSMPDLVAQGDGMAQSSLYRNLAVLEQAGVVRRIVTNDEFTRYELAEDLTGHHHHHLVCSECGSVTDVTLPEELERRVESALRAVADEHGFAGSSHQLDLMGRCATCRGRGAAPRAR